MLQPKFTRWPWGTLAVLAPVFASAAALLHYFNDPAAAARGVNSDDQFLRASSVFFGVLGAANGYLIGIAIGDLGRSVVALPLGAIMGFGATWLLREPAGAIVVTILFGIIMLNTVSNGVNILVSYSVIMLLVVILMTLVERDSVNSRASILLAYPLVIAIVTASMPLERSLEGFFSAFLVGARSSLYGMLVGVAAYCVSMTVFKLLEALLPGLMSTAIFFSVVSSVCVGAAVGNVYCMKLLFDAVYRVTREGEESTPSEPPPQPELVPSQEGEKKSDEL